MAEFEDKLNSILSNPALMGQIMSMAGSLGQNTPQSPPQASTAPAPRPQSPSPMEGFPGLDPAAMMGMMNLLKSTQIGPREQKLLHALEGYLPRDRLEKLTKAMQASKIAKYATAALNQSR